MRQPRSPTLPLVDHPLPFYCLLLAAAIPKPESHFLGSVGLLDTSEIRALPSDPPACLGSALGLQSPRVMVRPCGLWDAGSVPQQLQEPPCPSRRSRSFQRAVCNVGSPVSRADRINLKSHMVQGLAFPSQTAPWEDRELHLVSCCHLSPPC